MTDSVPVLLDPGHVDELRRLLGTVEDWLLHAGDEARDDLAEFLTGLGWPAATPERLVTTLISELGEHAITLAHASHASATDTGETS